MPEQPLIVIVGAGPVGLTLGLGLARLGIRSIILDQDDKLSEGSRAICIQRHTLEIFARLGAVELMMAKGVTRAYDEASGIKHPRIWTAERDLEMWDALNG